MATLLSPDMLPEDIRNMDFGQASMPHAPEAQTPEAPYDTEVMGNMRDLNEFASADHMSLAKMQDACHAALENVYGSEFTDALESGYDLNAESHDCASGSAVLETCDTTRAEQPTNHVKGVR